MERIIFTALTPDELRYLFADAVEHVIKGMAKNHPTAQPADAPIYVSKREAARLIGVCQSSVDNFARRKQLTRHYFGKAVRFERAEVLALAK